MNFDPARLPILRYDSRIVAMISHHIPPPQPHAIIRLTDIGDISDQPMPICHTRLPAVMCECRRFFLERAR